MMKTIAFGMAAAVAAAVAGSASAATFTMSAFNGVSPGVGIQYNYTAATAFNGAAAGSFQGTTAGRFNWTHDGSSVSTFCTQLGEFVQAPVTYDIVTVAQVPDAPPANPGPMGATKSSLIQDLYARNYAAVIASSDNNLNAAFQACIWEISHENLTQTDLTLAKAQLSFVLGAFQIQNSGASAAVITAANAMISGLGVGCWLGYDSLFGLTHETAQDQLIVIPIPAPALLAGLGLLGVGVIRRRISK